MEKGSLDLPRICPGFYGTFFHGISLKWVCVRLQDTFGIYCLISWFIFTFFHGISLEWVGVRACGTLLEKNQI
jgi:hypothetical protein